MSTGATLLYVGDLTPGSTSEQRDRAVGQLGFYVTAIGTNTFPGGPQLIARVRHHLYRAGLPISLPEPVGLNAAVVDAAQRIRPDVVLIDKGLCIQRSTLDAIRRVSPHSRIVGYSPDDMSARHNRSLDFDQHLDRYDAYITTKSYNVAELAVAGCKRVVFSENAFDPDTHRPMADALVEKFRAPVSFIGTYEEARAQSIGELARAGMPVRVWGSRWDRWSGAERGVTIEGHDVIGDDYARAISASDINLCFLRKLNRDIQTQRSVEIPACGGFMLAERTNEHLGLFKEGVEAEFFSSNEELIEKCRYYLANPEVRKKIAMAGRERCVSSGYDYRSRLADAFWEIGIAVMNDPVHRKRSEIETGQPLLYVGDLTPGSTSEQRGRAAGQLGYDVTAIGVNTFPAPSRSAVGVRHRLYRAGLPISLPEPSGLNAAVVDAAERIKPAVVLIDKGTFIRKSTLDAIRQTSPQCKIIGYSPDDMAARHNRSLDFDRHLNCYDAYITTKSYNVPELAAAGCKRVVFSEKAFDPDTHRPMSDAAVEKFCVPVSFIGTYEDARAKSIGALARAGIPVRVWGSRWDRWPSPVPNVTVEGHDVIGDDYARAISASDINLCFLRKLNRDLQTARSVEIPACGGFMLAERTDEHLGLFKEGVEAEFFSSDEELIEKSRHYLASPDERKKIAAAGRARCLSSGYDYRSRFVEAFRKIGIAVTDSSSP